MTTPPDSFGDRDRADREATDWLIRLQDEPDDVLARVYFEAWLSASPENAAAWNETRHVAALIDGTLAVRGDRGVKPVSDPLSALAPLRARRPRHLGGAMMAAAIAVVAVCLATVLLPHFLGQGRGSDYATGTAQVRTVLLDDGSIVRLGPKSAIDVVYSAGQRRIGLLRGEACFEVRRDPAHPFRVVAGDVTTTVLGTSFEVRLKPAGADVAVRHGLVRVDYRRGATTISEPVAAGERIGLRPAGPPERGKIDPSKVAAWTDRKLIVSDRRVGDVIDDLRPWYGGVILIVGARLKDRRVTGVYDLNDPVGALIALSQAHQTRLRRVSPWVVVLSAS